MRKTIEVENEVSFGPDINNMDDFERYFLFMKKQKEEAELKKQDRMYQFWFLVGTFTCMVAIAVLFGIQAMMK